MSLQRIIRIRLFFLELKKPERTVTLFIQCFHLRVKNCIRKIYHRLYSVWKEMKNTIEEIMDLLSACPNHIVRLKSEDKPKYHAAAVFASNLAVGLINQAKRLLMECGFDEDAALKALKPLTVTNMNNIFDVGTCDALTGPVERHDIKTVQKHLNALDQETKETYSALTKEIIKLAQMRHPDISYADMKHVLEEEK